MNISDMENALEDLILARDSDSLTEFPKEKSLDIAIRLLVLEIEFCNLVRAATEKKDHCIRSQREEVPCRLCGTQRLCPDGCDAKRAWEEERT